MNWLSNLMDEGVNVGVGAWSWVAVGTLVGMVGYWLGDIMVSLLEGMVCGGGERVGGSCEVVGQPEWVACGGDEMGGW